MKVPSSCEWHWIVLDSFKVQSSPTVTSDRSVIPQPSLVTIGDDCTLNEMSGVQCHSQEDGTFKSDYSVLGSNVTLGTASHVHYGVTIGDGAELTTDCFLMKGEEVPSGARWGGNPAHDISDRQPVTNALESEGKRYALIG